MTAPIGSAPKMTAEDKTMCLICLSGNELISGNADALAYRNLPRGVGIAGRSCCVRIPSLPRQCVARLLENAFGRALPADISTWRSNQQTQRGLAPRRLATTSPRR